MLLTKKLNLPLKNKNMSALRTKICHTLPKIFVAFANFAKNSLSQEKNHSPHIGSNGAPLMIYCFHKYSYKSETIHGELEAAH
jgi:hypothetical protein